MSSGTRNILSMWLGCFLFQQRKNHKVAAEDLSKKMGISLPYLRMLESGLTNIAPGRAFELIKGINESFSLVSHFAPVSNFLVAMHCVSNADEVPQVKEALNMLSAADQSMDRLLSNVPEACWTLLEKGEYEEVKSIFQESEMIHELKKFFTQLHYGLGGEDKFGNQWARMYKETPSILNEFWDSQFNLIKKDLFWREANTPFYNLSFWEKAHKSSFKSIYGFIYKADLLTEYIPKFDWSYLSNDHFDNITFELEEKEFSEKLKENIVAGIQKKVNMPLKDIQSKTNVRVINDKAARKLKSVIHNWIKTKSQKNKAGKHDNPDIDFEFWTYNLKNIDDPIGFILYGANPHDKSDEELESYIFQYESLPNNVIKNIREIIDDK